MSRSGDPILTPGDDYEFPRSYTALGRDALLAMRPGAGVSAMTSLAQLARRQAEEPVLPLTALVFHCSRCGSTLLGRLFQHAPGTRVFAEPEALPQFLHAHSAALLCGEGAGELKAFLRAFGLAPRPGETRLVIKLTSLSIAYLPVFRACFPAVPFIYLLRDPVEVVQSLSRHLPGFLHDRRRDAMAELFGHPAAAIQGLTPSEWLAWYVAQNLRVAFAHRGEFSHVVDHRNLRAGYFEIVRAITGAAPSLDDATVRQTLTDHSKGERRPFLQPADTDLAVLRPLVTPLAGPAYARWLEMLPRPEQPR